MIIFPSGEVHNFKQNHTHTYIYDYIILLYTQSKNRVRELFDEIFVSLRIKSDPHLQVIPA